ncbi:MULTISPECIES: restriction endonuclease subunit S [Magnetospirillum]|uniref:Type I restriction modification DNA specificity domain-containing protein n=1 Tax=Magnetospirillum aberrantis SpK TaxID=908842 RepID=A0A7C9QW31_9PROT|nr:MULTISPECIES: restriction endonuclease subunit S [Magnetospirillum]NFV81902.1 hypothetical protein [Magnetospirillum aberrantis SpK]OJX78256.1 MAG: hypothetical protein BGO92_02465 [Magnetospirillum sp. 64-120]
MTAIQPVAVATVPLREVATIYSGGTPSKANASFWVGDIPWVSPKDMGEDRISDAEDHISADAVEGSATKLVPTASILVVVRSGILVRKLPIGLTTRPVAFNQDIKALVVDETRFLPEFIFWLLRAAEPRALVVGVKKGATVHSLSAGYLESIPVPVLPLDEQRHIVDILNHAASIRRLREEARAKARDIIPALFVDMFGDPATNPKGWPVSRLDAEVSFVSGATPSKQEPRYWADGTPWVSAKDMKADPIVAAEDEVSDAAFAETNLKLIPAGSVLIVVRGMILAHTIPIRVNAVPVAINQDLKAMLPKPGMSEQFIRWCLQCLHNHLLAKISTAAHGTKKLEMDVLTALPIPAPPVPLQQEFAQRVAEVEGISSLNDRATTAAEQMAQSLLAQVFGQTA